MRMENPDNCFRDWVAPKSNRRMGQVSKHLRLHQSCLFHLQTPHAKKKSGANTLYDPLIPMLSTEDGIEPNSWNNQEELRLHLMSWTTGTKWSMFPPHSLIYFDAFLSLSNSLIAVCCFFIRSKFIHSFRVLTTPSTFLIPSWSEYPHIKIDSLPFKLQPITILWCSKCLPWWEPLLLLAFLLLLPKSRLMASSRTLSLMGLRKFSS